MTDTYMYESPDKGKTVYRRHFGESDKELYMTNVVEFPSKERKQELTRQVIQLGDQTLLKPDTRYEYLMVAKAVLEHEDYADICVGILDHNHYDQMETQLKKVVDSYYSFPT